MPLFTFPFDYTCTALSVSKSTFCLPIKKDCTPTPVDGIITEPGEQFNLNLCPGDSCYFIPYGASDTIQIQTLFVDSGGSAPTPYPTLINASIIDAGGTVIYSDIASFASRYMSGWNGRYNYQILEIDAAMLQGECFKVRFETADQTLETNYYQLERKCRDTILVKSTYKSRDCNNLWYGEPEEYQGDLIIFDNTMRYYAFVNIEGDTIQKERVGRKATNVTTSNFFSITMSGLVPAFIKRIFVNTHLAGERVFIDGNEFIFDDVSIEPLKNKGSMSHFEVRATRECTIIYNC